MNNLVYLVMMYRFGHKQGHSYLLGIFQDLEQAKHEAEEEIDDRGGKYVPEITEVQLNAVQHSRVIWPADHSRKDATWPLCEQCGQIIVQEKQDEVVWNAYKKAFEEALFNAHEAGVNIGYEKGGDASTNDSREYVEKVMETKGMSPLKYDEIIKDHQDNPDKA